MAGPKRFPYQPDGKHHSGHYCAQCKQEWCCELCVVLEGLNKGSDATCPPCSANRDPNYCFVEGDKYWFGGGTRFAWSYRDDFKQWVDEVRSSKC